MSKAAKIFGVLTLSAGAALYIYDPESINKLLRMAREQVEGPKSISVHQHRRSPEEAKTPLSDVNTDKVKYKAQLEEKMKASLNKEISKLRDEAELISEAYKQKLSAAELSGLRQVDLVASAFQAELERTRSEMEWLKAAQELEMEAVREDFNRLVEVKVNEQTRVRLAELNALGVMVEKLRMNTSTFSLFASMQNYTLRLIKLVNTLPHSPEARNGLEVRQDPFVRTILDSMPKQVDSIDTLNASFAHLKPELKQISLVPKDGGLFAYLISRMLTPFMFSYNTRIDRIDHLLADGQLFDALDELVELQTDGWNSLVLGDFVDRVRKRAEFDLGLSALDAHLGLISTNLILPNVVSS